MRYESKPMFYVDLSPKYHDGNRMLHIDTKYGVHLDQEKLIELRLSAANGSHLINSCNVIFPNDEKRHIFGTEVQTIDMSHPYNKNQLWADYHEYKANEKMWNEVLKLENQESKITKMQSFAEFIQSHNTIRVGITTKQIGQSNTLVTLLEPEDLPSSLGIKTVNIFEEFDFENLKVNLTVVVETVDELTKKDLMKLSQDINGQMSDGWGENYGIDKINESQEVSGWLFDINESIFVPSKHKMFYPQS